MKAPSLSSYCCTRRNHTKWDWKRPGKKQQKGKEKRWMMTITRHRYTHLSCLLFDSQRGALYGKEKKPACHQENTTKTKVQTKGLLDRFPLKSISCCITCCRSSNVNFTWDKILESKKVTRKWSQGPPKNGGGGRKTKRKKRKRKKKHT